MFSSSETQALAAKRNKEPSSSSSNSLARTDTIKAGYFDGDVEGGAAGREKEKGGAAAGAAPAAGKRAPLEPSGDLPPSSLSPSSPSHSSLSPAATAAARLAALSAELERLQKNQAVLADALARGRAVLAAPSSGSLSASAPASSEHHHSTLRGALADPPLVDPSPGAQAAYKKKLQRQVAKARGGKSSSKFVSGGLTGFEVAEDLLKVDFAVLAATDGEASSVSEFRAAAFDEPQTKQKLRSLRSQAAELLPAGDPKLASFLKQLEAQQRIILRMLAEGGGVIGGSKVGSGNGGAGSDSIPASLMLNPLLKNPLARLAAAGMTMPDDDGTAVTEKL